MLAPRTTRQRVRHVREKGELADLKARLPEHCHGQDGYVSDHRAQPEQWQKIEDTEEKIKALKAQLS